MRLEAIECGGPDELTLADRTGTDHDMPGLRALVAALPLSLIGKARFLQTMAGPRHRCSGGFARLDRLWRRHTLLWPEADLDDATERLVACALAFRALGAMPAAALDHPRSTEPWLAAAGRERMDRDARAWIAETIAALPGQAFPDTHTIDARARHWVLDLELSTLGERPDVFDADVAEMKAGARSGDAWTGMLHRLLLLRPLFSSEPIARRFTEPAYGNIERHLGRWQAAAA